MLKIDYPEVTYFIGTAREVTRLQRNLIRRGLAFQHVYDKERNFELDFNYGSLYMLSVNKDAPDCSAWHKGEWHKGECFILDKVDTQYVLLGEVEKQMRKEKIA